MAGRAGWGFWQNVPIVPILLVLQPVQADKQIVEQPPGRTQILRRSAWSPIGPDRLENLHHTDWNRRVQCPLNNRFFCLAIASLLAIGCQTPRICCHREHVAAALQSRTGHSLGPVSCPGEAEIPPEIALEDGLTEDEAVALALWNNAGYQELLSELGISRARLIEAGLLTDPTFTTYLPLGPKQLEFWLNLPLEALWLRPIRLRAAHLDLDRVTQQMVQNGLDVIRDVRSAHADLLLAQQRATLAAEAEQLRRDIADLAQKRLRAGDISELEATNSQVEALRAQADAARFAQDVVLARDRLRTLAGLACRADEFVAVESPIPQPVEQTTETLVCEALAARPDLRAAEIAIESAGERAGLARQEFMKIAGILDANGQGRDGFEAGPGLQLTIPIFNGNRGAIAAGDANLQKAMRQYVTIRDSVTLEVRTAYTQARQARENLDAVKTRILPALEKAVALAQKNYQKGGTSYFLVLQTTGQFLDARDRELELTAALRRAVAELERSVGRRLVTNPLPPEQPANINESKSDSAQFDEKEETTDGHK